MKKKEAVKKKERVSRTSVDSERLNSILIENFVGLQKAVTNLAVKFDSLSDNMSKLLQLFEISARSFAEKISSGAPDIEKDREFLDKLNKLLDQNKVIAKSLTLMEEKIRGRLYGEKPRMLPRPVQMQPMARYTPASEGYESTEDYLPSMGMKKEEQNEQI